MVVSYNQNFSQIKKNFKKVNKTPKGVPFYTFLDKILYLADPLHQ